MRRRISIRGRVRPSFRPSVRPSVPCYFQTRSRRILCRVSGLVSSIFPRLINGLPFPLHFIVWVLSAPFADCFYPDGCISPFICCPVLISISTPNPSSISSLFALQPLFPFIFHLFLHFPPFILGVPKKLLHKSEGRTAPKKEDDLAESWKLGTWVITLWWLFLQKNIFLFLINIADMAIWMSDFDKFDIDQMSSKFAQR